MEVSVRVTGTKVEGRFALAGTESAWYAVYVRSRHEKVVEESLKGKGYPVFSPWYRRRRKYENRTVESDLPLFPGYVFCQFDPMKRLPILKTPGVVHVIGRGREPEPIDEGEIASVRALVVSGKQVQPWPFLPTGTKVRVIDGPMAGAEGTLLEMKGENRLVASITLLQRSVAVVFDHEAVLPI